MTETIDLLNDERVTIIPPSESAGRREKDAQANSAYGPDATLLWTIYIQIEIRSTAVLETEEGPTGRRVLTYDRILKSSMKCETKLAH